MDAPPPHVTHLPVLHKKRSLDVALVQLSLHPMVSADVLGMLGPEGLAAGAMTASRVYANRVVSIVQRLRRFDVIAFGEYALDADLVRRMRKVCRPGQIILAGTHYVPDSASLGYFHNVSPLVLGGLDGSRVYEVSKANPGDFEARFFSRGAGGHVFDIAFEELRSTRIGVQICKDFMLDGDRQKLHDLDVQLLFVLCWNPRPDSLDALARDMVMNRSKCVAIVNAAQECGGAGLGHSRLYGYLHKHFARSDETSLLADAGPGESIIAFEYHPDGRVLHPGTSETPPPLVNPDRIKVMALNDLLGKDQLFGDDLMGRQHSQGLGSPAPWRPGNLAYDRS